MVVFRPSSSGIAAVFLKGPADSYNLHGLKH